MSGAVMTLGSHLKQWFAGEVLRGLRRIARLETHLDWPFHLCNRTVIKGESRTYQIYIEDWHIEPGKLNQWGWSKKIIDALWRWRDA